MATISRSARLLAVAILCIRPVRSQAGLAGGIEGDVVDASTGRGIAGARVRIQSAQDEPRFTTANEQGHFHFDGLEIQSYQVDASYPGFMSARRAAGLNGGETVSLGTFRPSAEIRLDMRRYGVIVGKVTDAVGVPAEGVTVAAVQPYSAGERRDNCGLNTVNGDSRYLGRVCTHTNDLGEYRLGPLAPGSYYVGVDPQPSPGRDPSERATYYPRALRPSETKPVLVAEGQELRADVRIVRQGGVKVSGRILGLGAGSAAGLHLSVYAVPMSTSAIAWSDLDIAGDRFQATDLLAGKYLFYAFQWASPSSYDNTVAAAQRTVEVGTADVGGIDLTLEPTVDMEGTVAFEKGCTVAPVTIMLRGDFARDLRVGTEGRFELPHLIPGKYKAYVQLEIPTGAVASSVKAGDTEVLSDGFEATANTKEPLRITMSCER